VNGAAFEKPQGRGSFLKGFPGRIIGITKTEQIEKKGEFISEEKDGRMKVNRKAPGGKGDVWKPVEWKP